MRYNKILFQFGIKHESFSVEDSVEIDISVVDVNDNRPEFLGFDASRPVVISVASDAQQGEVIKRLQVKKVLIKKISFSK